MEVQLFGNNLILGIKIFELNNSTQQENTKENRKLFRYLLFQPGKVDGEGGGCGRREERTRKGGQGGREEKTNAQILEGKLKEIVKFLNPVEVMVKEFTMWVVCIQKILPYQCVLKCKKKKKRKKKKRKHCKFALVIFL